jgi:hypothetical protein
MSQGEPSIEKLIDVYLGEGRFSGAVYDLFAPFGVTHIKRGSGTTAGKVFLQGALDVDALEGLGFSIVSSRIAVTDENSAHWQDLVAYAIRKKRMGV